MALTMHWLNCAVAMVVVQGSIGLQGLASPITDLGKVISQGHTLYLHAHRRQVDSESDGEKRFTREKANVSMVMTVVLGGIRIGRKQLFIADVRVSTVCVMQP
jgi:hypothetical protein